MTLEIYLCGAVGWNTVCVVAYVWKEMKWVFAGRKIIEIYGAVRRWNDCKRYIVICDSFMLYWEILSRILELCILWWLFLNLFIFVRLYYIVSKIISYVYGLLGKEIHFEYCSVSTKFIEFRFDRAYVAN